MRFLHVEEFCGTQKAVRVRNGESHSGEGRENLEVNGEMSVVVFLKLGG